MIGVFDSGVGGLTVLKALRRAMPHQDFLYLGDTARVPYGRKPPDMVRDSPARSRGFWWARGAEAIVVACNTATGRTAGSAARIRPADLGRHRARRGSRGPGHPIRPCGRDWHPGHHPQRGLPAASRSPRHEGVVAGLSAVRPSGRRGPGGFARSRVTGAPLLTGRAVPEIDTLILGCTHYPVLAPMLARVLGPGVIWWKARASRRNRCGTLGDDALPCAAASPTL